MLRSSRRALLRRIDDEIGLIAALPELTPDVALRALPAIEEAGDGAHAAEAIRPPTFEGVASRRLHAVAVLESVRLRAALRLGGAQAALEASALASIRAWAALAERREYLAVLAGPILGASAASTPAITARIGLDAVVEALEARARDTAADVGPLLRALSAAEALGGELAPRAARARLDAIDRAIEPLRRRLDELATRRPETAEISALFADVRAAWRRCDRDVDLEILAVERLADFAWDLYRERRLSELGRWIDELAELGSSLASRIERGEALAWAAPCAQLLVFRAELAPRFDAQITLAERAYAVCPTLRNARIVLGDFLLTRAERAMDRGADRTSAGTRPDDDVARAASLHPELKRLAAVREKLARRGALR